MKNEAFEELIESVREMKAIMRGEEKPARVFEFKEPDVAALRARFGASQREFAELIGISARTLQEWEQGRRKPQGPARVLLLVADKDPFINHQIYYHMGNSLYQLKKYDEALSAYNNALQIRPGYYEARQAYNNTTKLIEILIKQQPATQ